MDDEKKKKKKRFKCKLEPSMRKKACELWSFHSSQSLLSGKRFLVPAPGKERTMGNAIVLHLL